MDSKSISGLFFLVLLSFNIFMISQVSAVVDDGATTCSYLNPCSTGYHCSAGICVPNAGSVECNTDLDCNDWEYCSGGTCYDKVDLNKGCTYDHECLSDICSPFFRCGDCTVDSNCSSNEFCSWNVCTSQKAAGSTCTDNNECLSDLCLSGYCVSCGETIPCVEGYCDLSTNTCVECLSDSNCSEGYCLENQCSCLNGETCGDNICIDTSKNEIYTTTVCRAFEGEEVSCDSFDFCNYQDYYGLCSYDYVVSPYLVDFIALYNNPYFRGEFYDYSCVECTDNDNSNCASNEFCNNGDCIECLTNQTCQDNYCNLLEDSCLTGNTCGEEICIDNSESQVITKIYCGELDSRTCLESRVCIYDYDTKDCEKSSSASTSYYVKELYYLEGLSTARAYFYEESCVPQNECSYYCNLSLNQCLTEKQDFMEDCSYDSECISGYCSKYDYCTMECSIGEECPFSNYCFKENTENEFGVCALCDLDEGCDGGSCVNGTCVSTPTDGSAMSYTGSSYLGNRKFNTLYNLGKAYSYTKLVNLLKLPFTFSAKEVGNQISLNTTLSSYKSFYLSNVPAMFISTVPTITIKEKAESYQNVLLNYSSALEFILEEYAETEDLVLELKCSNSSSDYGFSDGKKDYSCVCGKGYFCEEGKPCACILKSPDQEFYMPSQMIFLTADTSLRPGSKYKWFMEDIVLATEKEMDISFTYPWIYPINLQTTYNTIQDNQTTKMVVLDENPVCYWDDYNNAYWLYSSGTDYIFEMIGGEQICNPEGYTNTCCPIGEYCTEEGTCAVSPSTQNSCSNYTTEENCTADPYNYALLNPILPEGSLGCSKPYYNSSQKAWYNTQCSCVWNNGACYSSYDLSKDGNSQGTCTYNKTIIAGDCSEGDLEYVYNMEAIWTGSGTKPSNCVNKNNIKESCSSGIIKLPFFTWLDFLITIVVIVIVYSLFFFKGKSKNRVKKT